MVKQPYKHDIVKDFVLKETVFFLTPYFRFV